MRKRRVGRSSACGDGFRWSYSVGANSFAHRGKPKSSRRGAIPYNDLRKGRFSASANIYFVTTVTAGRAPYFLDLACGRLVVAEMRRLHEAGYVESLAWVLMPDHVHWLFQLGRRASLSEVIKLFKARSARQINRLWARQGAVWQKAFHDHALRKEEDLCEVARYIVANPLRAGLVKHIGEYPLWDATWL